MIYLKNILAQHEIYVANFYIERKAYIAAVGRARYVLEHMPNTPQVPEALSILVNAYGLLDYQDLREKNFEILKTSYPNFDSDELIGPKRSWVSRLSFGLLGDEEIPPPLLDELDESCVSAGGDLFVCHDDWGPYVKEN
jgi:outer membrane protein assembly factor BamD